MFWIKGYSKILNLRMDMILNRWKNFVLNTMNFDISDIK